MNPKDKNPFKKVIPTTNLTNGQADDASFKRIMKKLGASDDEIARGMSKTMDDIPVAKIAKKSSRAIPVLGTLAGLGAALSSGDAAAALDIESAGMNGEDEDMFIAEQNGRNGYEKSQARIDRLEALKRLKGN